MRMDNGSVSKLLPRLREHLPEWPTGLAGRGLMLRHLDNILKHPHATEFLPTIHDLWRWRWQLLPWDRQTVETCSTLAGMSGRTVLPAWASKDTSPNDIEFPQAMQAISEGLPERVATLWRNHGVGTASSTWTGESCLFFLQRGDEGMAREILETTGLASSHPVHLHLRALLGFCFDAPDDALRHIRNLPNEFGQLRSLLQAQCVMRQDNPAGVKELKSLWRQMPWHTNLTLTLHGLLTPSAVPAGPDADIAVLIYSWNNADLLEATLHSLARSDLGAASVLVLDNGSSDRTPDVIRAAENLLGQRLKTLRLPVNIGAPAARNWLLRHPETRRFGTVVFLDDDVLLPQDWLTGLAAQFRQAGKSAVVGCRVMDQAPRQSVQTADVNLLDIEADGGFLIANAGGGELHLGLHDYTRPCLSVTGCCHMMDRRHAEELGGFDLRFNPSQFDDFDLDLRNALQGGHAVYAGRTAIRHCQRSSLNQADSEAKQGHIQGNMLKLRTKYTRSQKADLLHRNRDILWNDLISKTGDLEQA